MTNIATAFPAENAIMFVQDVGAKYLHSAEIDDSGFTTLLFKIGLTEKIVVQFMYDGMLAITSSFYKKEKPLDSGYLTMREAKDLFLEIVQYNERE
jgi:hypothetical protein